MVVVVVVVVVMKKKRSVGSGEEELGDQDIHGGWRSGESVVPGPRASDLGLTVKSW